MKVLLDTNAYTALLKGDAGVVRVVRRSESVLVSTVVAGELLFGFRNGSRFEANRRQLEEFLANPYVSLLPVDSSQPIDSAALRRPCGAKARPCRPTTSGLRRTRWNPARISCRSISILARSTV